MKYYSTQSNDKGGLNNSKDYSEQDVCSESFFFDNSSLIHQSGFSYEALLQQEALKKSKKFKHNQEEIIFVWKPASAREKS